MKGVDILLYANTGTDAAPVWTVAGGQRGAKLSEKVDTIEVTSKASAGHKEYEYGLGDWTISCDGVYVENDAGYQALVNALRNRTKLKVRWREGGTAGTDTYEGLVLVTSRDLEGPYDAEATYSMELQGTGAPTIAL